MSRIILLAIISVVLLAAGPASAQGRYLDAYSTCASSDSIYVIWTMYELAPDPGAYPEWVGYDVLRRAVPGCGTSVRANDEIIPRQIAMTHTRYFGEVVPSTATTFEYKVVPVDASHQPVFIPGGFCAPCVVYQECPPLSAAVTVGTLVDLGGWLFVSPCPGTCYPAPYLIEGPVADQLRPYAGTSTAFSLFGSVRCGGVEGCSMSVDHWELATCVTPTTTRSWGRLKTIYR